MNRSLAQILSYIFHPAIAPILGILAILKLTPHHTPSSLVIVTICVVFAGTYVIPVLISLILFRLGFIPGLEMKTSKERRFPYLLGALCYYVVALFIQNLRLPPEAYLYLLASTLVIVLHLFCLFFFKPSAHLAGMGGITGLLFALSIIYSINLLPFIGLIFLISGFVASARLYLKAHSVLEVVFGFFSGFLLIFVIVIFA